MAARAVLCQPGKTQRLKSSIFAEFEGSINLNVNFGHQKNDNSARGVVFIREFKCSNLCPTDSYFSEVILTNSRKFDSVSSKKRRFLGRECLVGVATLRKNCTRRVSDYREAHFLAAKAGLVEDSESSHPEDGKDERSSSSVGVSEKARFQAKRMSRGLSNKVNEGVDSEGLHEQTGFDNLNMVSMSEERAKEIQEFLSQNVKMPLVSSTRVLQKGAGVERGYNAEWSLRAFMLAIGKWIKLALKVSIVSTLALAVAVLAFRLPGRLKSTRDLFEPKVAFAAPSARQHRENNTKDRKMELYTEGQQAEVHRLISQGRERGALPQAWPSWQPVAVSRRQAMKLDITPPNLLDFNWSSAKLTYTLDVLLEKHPATYILLLMVLCFTLVSIGGVVLRSYREPCVPLGEAMWESWANVCSSRMHLREKTKQGRIIGMMLALGGLLFYSLLTSTMTAKFKERMERIREGGYSQVMESQHIIVVGSNNHIGTVLRQLNKSHEFAVRDGTADRRKQTVLVLSEQQRRETERHLSSVSKDCKDINILTRSGSLSSTSSFEKIAADKARSIILLASKDDNYESDADSVLSVLALQPLVGDRLANVVVEVSKTSTAELLYTLTGIKISAVEDLSAKLFVQCSRQPGLIDVYRRMLDHGKEVINLRHFPELAGLPYREVRRGFQEAVVCGIVREGEPKFRPWEFEILQETDKLMLIAPKHTHREPPAALTTLAAAYRKAIPDLSGRGGGGGGENIIHDTVLSANLGAIVQRPAKAKFKTADWTTAKKERIVMLGWRLGVTDMILEYDDYVGPGSELVILAQTPIKERQGHLSRRIRAPLRNLHVTHKVGSIMSRTDIRDAILNIEVPVPGLEASDKYVAAKKGKNYGFNSSKDKKKQKQKEVEKRKETEKDKGKEKEAPLSIVVISDRSFSSGSPDGGKPDKQSVFSLLLAEAVCRQYEIKLQALVAELVDTKLGKQVVNAHPSISYVSTSDLMGLVISQVAEHNDLLKIWEELLNSWGDEIYVKNIELYKRPGEEPTFAELAERAVLREEVAIGIRQGGRTMINPPKDVPLSFTPGDSLVLISEFE